MIMQQSDTRTDAEQIALLDAICATFPEVAEELDRTLKDVWEYGPHDRHRVWTDLIERFSQITTDAIRRNDEQTARAYLSFIEDKYRSAGAHARKAIDVYYVESLLWDIKDVKQKTWGWSLIPKPLQDLYVAMWGQPEFEK